MLGLVIAFSLCLRARHSVRILPWVKDGKIPLFDLRKLQLSHLMAEEAKHPWVVEILVLSRHTCGGLKSMIPSISAELPVDWFLMESPTQGPVPALVGCALPMDPPHVVREPRVQIWILPLPSSLTLCSLRDFSDLQSPLL